MATLGDFPGWTPEEIRNYALTGTMPEGKGFKEDEHQETPHPGGVNPATKKPYTLGEALSTAVNAASGQPENYEPLGGTGERFLAGIGRSMSAPFRGAAEKFQIAFPGDTPEAKARTLADIAEARHGDTLAGKFLGATPAGNAGEFLGKAIPAALLPPSAGAQALGYGVLGALSGGPEKPTGLLDELGTSAVQGGIDAASAGAMTSLGGMLGQSYNAARGKFSPEGLRARGIDQAAKNLGLSPLPFDRLYPGSPSSVIASKLPGYPAETTGIADELGAALQTTRQVPKAVGRGTETQATPGGALADDLAAAVNARKAQGRAKYQAVDEFAMDQGLDPLVPTYTYGKLHEIAKKLTPQGKSAESNLALSLLTRYDEPAFDWLRGAGARGISAKDAVQGGIPMSTYHDMRVATNRAINQLDRAASGNTPTADVFEARSQLIDLKRALDADAERWAKQNAGNTEAMGLYNNAKEFYANVVAPAVLDNPIAKRSTSMSRGYQSADQMYADLLNPQKQEMIDRLLPTMNQRGRDTLSVFRDVPGVGKILANPRGEAMPPSGEGTVGPLLKASLGHPLIAASEMMPGLSQVFRKSNLVKRLAAAEDPTKGGALGRALAVGAQYPANETEMRVRNLLSLPQR